MRRKRAGSTQAGSSAQVQSAGTLETAKQDTAGTVAPRRSAQPIPSIPAASDAAGSLLRPGPTASLSPSATKALEIYEKAVAHEQRSELDEALRLYRQAFRIHEDVARLYERSEYHSLHMKASVDMVRLTYDMDKLHVSADSSGGIAVTLPAHHGVVTGTLAGIMAPWGLLDIKFEPEDEKEPVYLQTLPDELLVHILEFLNTTSLERFALVNRKARVLTLDSSLWRRFVLSIYQSPQIGEKEDITELVEKYMGDFRRVYIEHPRVRLDGVYIAVCHYIRDGLSENAWVNVSHLITYHRYLRFYPNGEVLSLLTNEEVSPQQAIPLLKPTLRMKGFFIGNWRLEGTTVYITDLMNPSGDSMRYSFQMILELRSRPLGRWNRLDFRAYDSVSLASGEATPLALKNDRPFWFSKVRSYAV
ncbi:uncharacterized protein PHACADRAFT_104974 [Phanerochaete carnosa HHB-10118-sp]|uniref:F-box domain-containing protein n=1 Tax=Phanerochaete carnosa (strain HHB-10118-sp) TaxID=650164 RepID=K5VUL5_PHACS|nr:uncharacterized protein PHACADRAFT_104974 [Phanerochaete carnosa HHB-10118-sp]EKM50500.1 hypothetical protein PHACADRAFT_104974 [Phanerochaete carnosa HHB-10118-sp]